MFPSTRFKDCKQLQEYRSRSRAHQTTQSRSMPYLLVVGRQPAPVSFKRHFPFVDDFFFSPHNRAFSLFITFIDIHQDLTHQRRKNLPVPTGREHSKWELKGTVLVTDSTIISYDIWAFDWQPKAPSGILIGSRARARVIRACQKTYHKTVNA